MTNEPKETRETQEGIADLLYSKLKDDKDHDVPILREALLAAERRGAEEMRERVAKKVANAVKSTPLTSPTSPEGMET